MSKESYKEQLEFEITDEKGIAACRVMVGDCKVFVRFGSEVRHAFDIPPHAIWHKLVFEIDCKNNTYKVFLNGNEYLYSGARRFLNKVNTVERLIIRTKPRRYLPNIEIYPETPDLENADDCLLERIYYITNVKTEDI